ncbi:hypothetical protein LTR66_008183 [Elasticomyces elasticus]|nr:hypothetical protein LTR66_008183 [Elasticomyces elasticus]
MISTDTATTTFTGDQETVTSFNEYTESTTITIGPLSTVTSTATYNETIDTVTTVYYKSSSAARRARRMDSPSKTCNAAATFSLLEGLALDALGTACSCIGEVPITTETDTKTLTVVHYTTVYAAAVPTTTVVYDEHITFTFTSTIPAPTVLVTKTQNVTSTGTVSLPAPTYTKIFGPQVGCADVATGPAEPLSPSVTDIEDATQQCQDLCTSACPFLPFKVPRETERFLTLRADQATCAFVYVQYMFPDYVDTTPYYECYFNPSRLDEATDMKCGQSAGIYGSAIGYDASGR